MLNRIYIDNYKCFVNFECSPTPLQLLLGDNGSGKTAIFDMLENLRECLTRGTEFAKLFPTSSLTEWETRNNQTFELGITGNGGQYLYRLVLEHDFIVDRNGVTEEKRSRIKEEILSFDQKPLYYFNGSDVNLYRDDFSPGPVYPFDWSRSAIATIPQRNDNHRLIWFRNRFEKIYIFSPDPLRMTARSDGELERPDRRLHQLVSWLRHLSQESVDTVAKLRDCLRDEVIEGLSNMKLEKVSDVARLLKFEFDFSSNGRSKPFDLSLEQLSEGQRNLVALFAIVQTTIEQDSTVCIDEPDNFVALRELQPWLTQVRDKIEDENGQCLIISHHPELIDYLAAKHGLLMYRDESGPVRAKAFDWKEDKLMSPSEVLARGWER